jgi:hypothetical protein
MLAPTPRDLSVLGWSMSAGDPKPLISIISTFLKTHNLESKPLILAGASAGGGIAQELIAWMPENHVKVPWKISGIISEVQSHSTKPDTFAAFPPIVFVVMERDPGSIVTAKEHVKKLTARHIRAGYAVSPVRAITPTYFQERVPGVTAALSKQIHDALLANKMIDPKTQLLTKNPKDLPFRAELHKLVPAVGNLVIKTSPIMQALLVAYGEHEHVSDYTTAALDFLENGGNFADLIKTKAVAIPTAFNA